MGFGKQKKIPPQAQTNRVDKKTVKNISSPTQETQSWRFSSVDLSGSFKWPKNQNEELEILQKLHSFDSMVWSEILGSDHHMIQKNSLSKAAKDRLTEIKQDDIDEMISFHFSGKKRIFGIRDRNIVKLLWWDTDHKVCPSKLKHT
jgi:hypothetical protein